MQKEILFYINKKMFFKIAFLSLLITTLIPNYIFIFHLDILEPLLNFKHIIFQFNLFLFLIFFLYLITIFLKKILSEKKIEIIFEFLILWVFTSGLIIPVAGRFDPFFNKNFYFTNFIILVSELVILIFVFYIFYKKNVIHLLKKFILSYSILVFFLTSFQLLNSYVNEVPADEDIYRLGKKNFIVIGFDGLPHNFFENLIKNKKESEYLKDFIVYNNVIVPFPTTKLSLFSEFNNINKINNDKNLSEEIKKRNYIFKDDKGILVYGAYNQIIKNKKIDKVFRGQIYDPTESYYSNYFFQNLFIPSLSRWATPLVYKLSNKIINYKYYNNFLFLFSNLKLNENFIVNLNSSIALNDYEKFIKNMSVSKDNRLNKIKLMHFDFSHWPVIFDDKCKNKMSSIKWEKISNPEKLTRLNNCISLKIKDLILKMKKLNVYNNTYIIFKGDHGKPNSYYVDGTIENIKIKNNHWWGIGRYKTTILLKKQNQLNHKPQTINQEISSSKLLNEIYCDQILICDKSIKEHFIFLPKYNWSFTNLNDFQKYQYEEGNLKSILRNHSERNF